MSEKGRFDLGSRNIVAGRDDHVVGARLEPEIAVFVLMIRIASDIPAVLNILFLPRIGEVAAASGATHGEAAGGSARQVVASVVDQFGLIAGDRKAGGAGLHLVHGSTD